MKKTRAIDLVDFFYGWHCAMRHFWGLGHLRNAAETLGELERQYEDFQIDEYYPNAVKNSGLFERLKSIVWFTRERWFDIGNDYLVVTFSLRACEIGINISEPRISFLFLSARLTNVPFCSNPADNSSYLNWSLT